MQSELAVYIMKETKRRQIALVVLTLLLFPVLYGLLNIPKVIINEAIGSRDFPQNILTFAFDQIDYLVLLSSLFFGLIVGNAIVKYCLNVAQGRTTEIAIAGLRRKAYHHVMGLPLNKVQSFSSPELIQMMTTEIEPIGNFAGDILALPFRQGGTLITILLFVFIQDVYMGLAAISLYPIQAYIVPIFQRKVNRLIRERYRALQFLSEEIQDSFEGLEEVRSLNLVQRAKDRFDTKSYNLLSIRNRFYRQKYLLKLVNSLIGNFIPFLFYTAGGFFVIQGELTLGALVSIVAAHKDLQAPWMELLNFYQRYNEADHRYRRLLKKIEYKDPPQENEGTPEHIKLDFKECDFVGRNLYFAHEHSKPLVEATNFRFKPTQKVAIVSPIGQGEGTFVKILSGLISPNGGDIFISNATRSVEPKKLLGHDLMFTGQESHIFAGTILDNLYLNTDRKFTSVDDLTPAIKAVELEEDLSFIGLNKVIPDLAPALRKKILMLRKTFHKKAMNIHKDGLVEFYEKDHFLSHMSVAENIIFGAFNAENLNTHSPDILSLLIRVIKSEKLDTLVVSLGHEIAKNLVDMFSELTPGHPFFEQYCLFEAQDLDLFQDIINNYPRLTTSQEQILCRLVLRYIPSKHRIIDIPDVLTESITKLRKKTIRIAPKDILRVFVPFDSKSYHPLLSVWENIFFGRFYSELSNAQQKGTELFEQITKGTDFNKELIELGLYYHAGLAGKNLSRTQRQKIGIARALISSAQLLVFDRTTATIEHDAHHQIQKHLLSKRNKKGLIWLLHRPSLAKEFDMILVFKDGRITEQGTYEELIAHQGEFKQLLDAEFKEGAP